MTLTQDNINGFIQYLVDNHIVTTKNGKFRVISIWKKSNKVSDEAKDIVNEFVSGYRTEKEAWFCLGHHIFEIPKCPICGNLAKFTEKGYNLTCGNCNYNNYGPKKEKAKLSTTKESKKRGKIKYEETCLKKYGKKSANQFVTQEKKQAYIEDCQRKYGSNNAGQSKEAKQKREQTMLSKYGVKHNFTLCNTSEHAKEIWSKNHDKILEKQRNTLIEHYGSLKEARKHINDISWEIRHGKKSEFENENSCTSRIALIKQYGRGWLSLNLPQIYNDGIAFIDDKYVDDIKNYKPSEYEIQVVSEPEKEIAKYVKSLVGEENVITSDRRTIKISNKYAELDIYVPSYNLAIEYNGIYWHSTTWKDNDYHLKKTLACNEKGIRLIHVFQDEWNNYPDKIKSLIRTAFNMFDHRIGARKCIMKEISSKEYREFCSEFHLQGPVNSSYRLGLYYSGQLIQCIGIGKSRFKKNEMELHRMCTRDGWQVIGGFSRLMKKASNDLKSNIISYIARDKFNGNGYLKCGFNKISETKPSYFYIDKRMKRHSRIEFQKYKIKENKKLIYDENKTEQENMLMNKFRCVYDCGTIKMNYKYQNESK